MRYATYRQTGGVDQLELQQGPIPISKSNEVLIRVYAAGINRPDIFQRQGLYPAPADASPILGLEVAGEVVSVGEDVKRWRAGDKVCALVNGGGYAQYVAVTESQCLSVPGNLSYVQAAALPETFFTVWHNLWQRAQLKSGETLLVHGGSSGIGIAAIQISAALGVKVFATAGSDEKCSACEQSGAAHAINYRKHNFVDVIKQLTDGHGVNVILDMVGGDYMQRNFSAIAIDGRIVNIAFLRGSKVELDMMPLMLKRVTWTGSTLRAQSPAVKAQIATELEATIWPLIEQEKIKPIIAATFPLENVGAAHQLMESNAHIGKIVLTID